MQEENYGRVENLKFNEYVDPYRGQNGYQQPPQSGGISPGSVPGQAYQQQYQQQYQNYSNNQGYSSNGGNNGGNRNKGLIIAVIVLAVLVIASAIVITLILTGVIGGKNKPSETTTEITTEMEATEVITEAPTTQAVITTEVPTTESITTEGISETSESFFSPDGYTYCGSATMGYIAKPSFYQEFSGNNDADGLAEYVQIADPYVNMYDENEANVITLARYSDEYDDMDTLCDAMEAELKKKGTVTKQNAVVDGYDAVWFRLGMTGTDKLMDTYLFKTDLCKGVTFISIEYTSGNEFLTEYLNSYTTVEP